jgi:hypothetical protein
MSGAVRDGAGGAPRFTEDALPAVQPVNLRLCGDDVVIRVAGGAKLATAERNFVVAFQADELDPDLRAGWSVTVVGHAQRITDVDKLVEVSGTFLQPWVDGRRDHFIRIRTERVTGRRLRASVDVSERAFRSGAQAS